MATIVRRVGHDGTTSYQARVRVRGERPRSRTFKRKTDAVAWATKAESDLGHGSYVPTTADRRRTLGELIDKFTAEYLPVKPNSKDGAKVAAMLQWWKDQAGFVTLDKLTPQTVAGYRAELSAKPSARGGGVLSGATVNRYLAALSAVCKWAWKELGWLPSNPVLAITKRSEGAGVVRFLSDDERKSLLTECRASDDPNIYCAVMLALATGARRGNIFPLRWEDVDLERMTLLFADTKNGQPRRVPIVGPAVAAIRQQWERDPTQKGWVFKGRSDDAPANLDKPWAKVRDAAGLVDFRFHDLRHTTASYLTMNGASLAEVAEALGHRTLVMARRYIHMTGDHTRGVLERMAGNFLGDDE
ncbi:tyrosine-type recombinase/integrase [Rhodanobacter ginsengiterrae]|uniref:tyrosine-type recombinase/integrase n=1 Tax=Rhodanobacter ginsengiterrae TaxID=2008451 RepID=UPI003CE794BE